MAVIGDLVASREAPDRAALQHSLTTALADVNALVPATLPLTATVGDEFQGTYPTLARAALAALLVRLALLEAGADLRVGLGRGTTRVIDAAAVPPVLDGTAWWAARRAVEHAERFARSPRTRTARTWWVDRATGGPGQDVDDGDPAAGAVNAFFAVRDDALAAMTPRARRLLAGLLRGTPQAASAAAEGITQPAVSQAIARSGAAAVVRGHELLGAARVPALEAHPDAQPGADPVAHAAAQQD